MKQIIILFGFIFLVGCNSNEKNPVIQKKLDAYFENSSNVNLDKEIRLKYIDSAKNIIHKASENDSIKIKNNYAISLTPEYKDFKTLWKLILDTIPGSNLENNEEIMVRL